MTLRRADGLRRRSEAEISANDRARSSHTGTQAIATVDGLAEDLDALDDAAAAAATLAGLKANASALGVSASAANLGTMAPALIPDNSTAKAAIEAIGSNLEGDAGASYVSNKRDVSAARLPLDVILEMDDVCPEQFRQPADVDDTASMSAAIEYARATNKSIRLTAGREYVIGPMDFSGVRRVHSQGLSAVLKAKAGSRDGDDTAFISYRDMVRAGWNGVRIDASGEFDIGFDTTYSLSVGPSLNVTYKEVHVQGFMKIGWLAENNNDVWIENCLVFEPGATCEFTGSISGTTLTVTAVANGALSVGDHLPSQFVEITALGTGTGGVGTYTVSEARTFASGFLFATKFVVSYKADAIGGPVHFMNCNFLAGPVNASAQWIGLVNTVSRGMMVGADGSYNNISIAGSHIFPDPKTGLNIEIQGECWGLVANGTHFENNTSGGAIVGGTGTLLCGSIDFVACHILRYGETSPAINPVLGRSGLTIFGGNPCIFRVVGGVIENMTLSLPWAVLDGPGANINGSFGTAFQRYTVRNPTRIASLGADGMSAQVTGGFWGTSVFRSGVATTVGDAWTPMVGVPSSDNTTAIVIVHGNIPETPMISCVVTNRGYAHQSAYVIYRVDGTTGAFVGSTINFRFNAGAWEMQMAGPYGGDVSWTITVMGALATG